MSPPVLGDNVEAIREALLERSGVVLQSSARLVLPITGVQFQERSEAKWMLAASFIAF